MKILGNMYDLIIACPKCQAVLMFNSDDVTEQEWELIQKREHLKEYGTRCPRCDAFINIRHCKKLYGEFPGLSFERGDDE